MPSSPRLFRRRTLTATALAGLTATALLTGCSSREVASPDPASATTPAVWTGTDAPAQAGAEHGTSLADETRPDPGKQVFLFYQSAFDRGDLRQAAEDFIDVDLIEHTPGIAGGRDAYVAALEAEMSTPGFRVSIDRMVSGDDMVAVYGTWTVGGVERTQADFYRTENGRIAEHWSVQQPGAQG